MAAMPLSAKKGMKSPKVTYKSKRARPVTTSGKTMGAVIKSMNADSPAKVCTRTITKAAMVPMITEAAAAMKAMVSEVKSAEMMA